MESDIKIKDQKEEKVKVFLDKICKIDDELKKLVSNFNDGLEELSLLKFESNETQQRLNSRGFTIGPAYTTVVKEGDKLKLETNEEDPNYYEELEILKAIMDDNPDEDFSQKNTFEEFQENIKRNHQKEKIDHPSEKAKQVTEDEIFNRFGFMSQPKRMHLVRDKFNKTLENILNIANVLHSLK